MLFCDGSEQMVGLNGGGIEAAVPGFAEFFELEGASQALGDAKVPIVRGDSALLPIMPAGIFFYGGPQLSRRQRNPLREAGNGACEIQFDEHAANIKNDSAKRSVGHQLVLHGTSSCWLRRCFFTFDNADDCGKNGNKDDDRDDVVDVLADIGNRAAERKAAENHSAYPEDTSEDVVAEVSGVGHASGASDGWAKSSNDGSEAREDHGTATVLFIKIMGPLQM